MVLIMIGIGGFTRLTGSGLSIVEWKPIVGIIPPLTESAWINEFNLYKAFPEYILVNHMMTFDEFRFIYFVEYFHRFWGRAMGLVLLVPTIYAAIKYRKVLPSLGVIWLLAITQAGMGWYMVKSGLINDPMVSPFRLTSHLLLALIILFAMTGILNLLNAKALTNLNADLLKMTKGFLVLLLMTITYGGLTAGNHAGLIYNSFPDMNGDWVPHEFLHIKPWYLDLITNPASIQYLHRILATLTTIVGIMLFLKYRNTVVDKSIHKALHAIAGLVGVQFSLGIFTLLLIVPVSLGVLHQITACALFTVSGWLYWRLQFNQSRVLNPISHQKA